MSLPRKKGKDTKQTIMLVFVAVFFVFKKP